jgi:diguanylate cyclase (GGDEF)-like protein
LNRLKGYSFGAVDYIAKPINDTILLSKIRVFLELYRSRAELRATLGELSQRNEQLLKEVSERQRAEEKARHEATHDALTGLPNRLLFIDRLHSSIERARRRDSHCALLYIDIDGFKPVNDSYGHTVGDALLCSIAERMAATIRKIDSVARLGGDEFGVIIEEPLDINDAVISADRLNRALREPYRLRHPDGRTGNFDVTVSASIGVALFPQHADSTDALIRLADDAMYRAKRAGKNLCLLAISEHASDNDGCSVDL